VGPTIRAASPATHALDTALVTGGCEAWITVGQVASARGPPTTGEEELRYLCQAKTAAGAKSATATSPATTRGRFRSDRGIPHNRAMVVESGGVAARRARKPVTRYLHEVAPGTPVVTLTDPALADAVITAAAHAAAGGRIETVTLPAGDAAAPVSADEAAEIVVIVAPIAAEERDVLRAVLDDGGRAITALGLVTEASGVPSVTPASLDLLGDPSLRDLHVAVPAFENDGVRTAVWDQLRDRQVEARHQLAEVSGGTWASLPVPGSDPWAAAGAFAAGILAGRIAAGNRRWRAQLQR
jgi:hypothetical protein